MIISYDMLEGNYKMPDGVQKAVVEVEMTLREFKPNKYSERTEHIEMHLSKNGRLRIQAVCGPALMKCEKCGDSITLMEGKVCVIDNATLLQQMLLYSYIVEGNKYFSKNAGIR